MPLDTLHRDHVRYRAKVNKVRDMIEGGQAAKQHIIKLPAHDAEEYEAWRDGASFLPATERTLDAFVGMIMEPEPKITAPSNMEELLQDVSNNGEPFNRVCARVVSEVLTSGRTLLVVDAPSEDAVFKDSPLARTAGNYKVLGGRPYAKQYTYENILYWRCEMIGGMKKLVELRVMEYEEKQNDQDEWLWEATPKIRVFDLFNGRYRQRVYGQQEKQVVDPHDQSKTITRIEWVQEGEDIFPKVGKNPPGEIPAVMIGPDTLDPEENRNPPLLDLANLNCDHLQNSASLENTVRNLGCATLFIKAHPDTDEEGNTTPIRFGSNQAIIVPDGDAKLLSLTADGVSGITNVMERKEKQMVAIGARALMIDQQGGQVSTETERIRRAGEHSMLGQVANTVSDGMTKVLQYLANWASVGGEVRVELNTDFLPAGLQPGELTEWVGALMQGAITLEAFMNRLKERGVIDPDKDVDTYREELEDDDFGAGMGGQDETVPDGDAGGTPPEDEDEGEEDE